MQAIYLLVQQHDGQVSIGLTISSRQRANARPILILVLTFSLLLSLFLFRLYSDKTLDFLRFAAASAMTKTDARKQTRWLACHGGRSDVCRKAVEFCSSFWALVTTRTPKLHSASKSDTDPVRLWQTCHSTYCKSMYHHKGLGNILWRLKNYMLLL